MAHFCNQWTNITFFPNHVDYPRFKRAFELFQKRASLNNTLFDQGAVFYNEGVFNIEEPNFKDTNIKNHHSETKYRPIGIDCIEKLMNEFPCIKKVAIDYDEVSYDEYGRLVGERVNGFVNLTKLVPSDLFFNAVKIREAALEKPFKDIKEACSKLNLTEKQVSEVLEFTETKITDWDEGSESIEIESYPMVDQRDLDLQRLSLTILNASPHVDDHKNNAWCPFCGKMEKAYINEELKEMNHEGDCAFRLAEELIKNQE
ncbi:hypothetical protein OAH77_04420 [Flavobacteriaceae bacterium]|nr:hypothetical protein [Flavobacteriaceae bacterium]